MSPAQLCLRDCPSGRPEILDWLISTRSDPDVANFLMNDTAIRITRPGLGNLGSDPDLERALDAHRHAKGIRAAIDAGHFHVARFGGAHAGGMIADRGFFQRGFVWLIWVEEPFRRNGVASALMRHAEETCPSDDLFTSTNQSNIPAQRLFEKLGYTKTGIIENLDEGDPEIFYFKRLR